MSDWVKKDVCYLHIPKTGGNWVRSILRGSGIKEQKSNFISKHASYDLIVGANSSRYNFLNDYLSKKIKFFCVVRHPLLWYQSWFNYQGRWKEWRKFGQVGNLSKKKWHCLSSINSESIRDFNKFINNINKSTPGFLTYLYYSYILSSGARVLKNELLRDQLCELNREWKLGLNESLILHSKKINESNKSKIIWSEENVKNTLENEKAIIKKFNYSISPEEIIKIK